MEVKSTPGTTLVKKPGMSRVKLVMRVRPTGPLVSYELQLYLIPHMMI